MPQDDRREFLRHTVATLAYRGGKAVRDAPEGFGAVRACEGCRSAAEVLDHIGNLLEWGLGLAKGVRVWPQAPTRPWDEAVARFFDGLRRLDEYLASDAPLGYPAERIFQGPIADALWHVGQLATLRRVAGAPVRGENYFMAEIAVGRTSHRSASSSTEAALWRRVARSVPVGILGYLDGEPVAWCSIAPRPTYRRLGGPPEDEAPERVWSLVCFFVPRREGGQEPHGRVAALRRAGRTRGNPLGMPD